MRIFLALVSALALCACARLVEVDNATGRNVPCAVSDGVKTREFMAGQIAKITFLKVGTMRLRCYVNGEWWEKVDHDGEWTAWSKVEVASK